MARKNLLPIGEVSRLFHISVSTLRHYEAIGLLIPAYISPDSGYRYYGTEQFEILNTIRYLRALDMPLARIEEFLENREISQIEELLQEQRQVVLRKQEELRRIEQKIDHRLRWLSDAQHQPLDTISLVQQPACRIVWVDGPLQIDGFQDMEAPIRQLDQSDAEAVVFLGKVGLGISAEHLAAGQISQYDGIFLVLDQEDVYTGSTIALPEMLSARLRFQGHHNDAPAQYKRLLQYLSDHHLEIAGFSREITLIDYGVTNDPHQFVTEISIPIRAD